VRSYRPKIAQVLHAPSSEGAPEDRDILHDQMPLMSGGQATRELGKRQLEEISDEVGRVVLGCFVQCNRTCLASPPHLLVQSASTFSDVESESDV
jgi:hypothetical protein